jgi:hypothetical protein
MKGRGRDAAGAWAVLLLATGVLFCPASIAGQEIEDELARIDEGWATLVVEVREGVEVCDRGIRWYGEDGERRGHWHGDGVGEDRCDAGPLQLDFQVLEGRVEKIEAGRVSQRAGARKLTSQSPVEVSDYLVGMAYHGASDDAAEEGLFLSRLPRGADPTQGILRVAQDRDLSSEVRKSGLFWAGQLATEVVVAPLRAVAVEEEEDQELRDAAVFALSQHQGDAATPALMELALEAPHPGTRRSAMFWLAQRDDPEVADFLADVIMGRRGG